MKIRNTILLFAIKIFINFQELNASPEPWDDEASAMPNFVVNTPRLDLNFPPPVPRRRSRQLNTMPEHHGASHLPNFENFLNPPRRQPQPQGRRPHPRVAIHYLNRIIHVVLKPDDDGNYAPKECVFAEGGSGTIPDNEYKTTNDFYVYAIYGSYGNLHVKCVIYVKQTNLRNEAEIVGVKLPPPPGQSSDKSVYPGVLDPDLHKWFITCNRMDFMIRQDDRGVMREVTTRTTKNRIPKKDAILSHDVYTFEVYIGGAYFLAFLKNDKAYGVMFEPKWWNPLVRAHVLGLPPPQV